MCTEELKSAVQEAAEAGLFDDCNCNPCLNCDCYNPDFGCTMPSIHRSYACSLESDDEFIDELYGLSHIE